MAKGIHPRSACGAPAAGLVGLLVLLFVATGCSGPRRGGYYADDGPPGSERELAAIPDAVPKREPFSRGGNRPYTVFNKNYRPMTDLRGYNERGVASWYGKKFHGKRTSNGETYDMYKMSAAHKTLPIPCYARVRNLRNGREVVVRVNDRGPFLHNRLIDLSYAAATRLGIVASGTGLVEVTAIDVDAPVTASTQSSAADAGPASAPKLYVQLGAFATDANAEQLRARFADAGFSDLRVQRARASGLYQVRIGPLASIEDSDRLIARAQRQGAPSAYLVIE